MKYAENEKWSLIVIYKYFNKNRSLFINECGFFNLYFIFFLTLLMTFVFAFGFIFYASQSKDLFRTACATTAVEIQKNLIKSEKSLFLLNAPSTALRLQLFAVYALLAVTPPPQDLPLFAELELIETQQEQLDLLQKNIIRTANSLATVNYFQLISKANINAQVQKNRWSHYLNIFTFVKPSHLPKLAVRSDSLGGVAPNYELESEYRRQQGLELIWQNWFSISTTLQKIFSPKNFVNQPVKIRYGLVCRVEPERINNTWDLKISLDKF